MCTSHLVSSRSGLVWSRSVGLVACAEKKLRTDLPDGRTCRLVDAGWLMPVGASPAGAAGPKSFLNYYLSIYIGRCGVALPLPVSRHLMLIG